MRNQLLLAAAAFLGASQLANATPMLKLSTSDGASVLVSDGGAGDMSAAGDGIVLFNGSLGNWATNVSTGVSKPTLGSADEPELDLNSLNLSSSGPAGSIEIWLTDTGFNAKSGLTGMLAAIGGTTTTSGEITYRTFFDPSNTPFGQANELTSFASTGVAFSSALTSAFSSLTQYSLTLLVTITHAASSKTQVSSFDAVVKVPAPSTLLLFGAGLLGMGTVLVARRRRLAQAR